MLTLLLLLALSFGVPLHGTHPPARGAKPGVKHWSTHAEVLSPEVWQAYWIWSPHTKDTSNVMLLARREFRLPAVPGRARLYITADTRYQLFINGQFVNRGPARCAPHHQSYDVLDVAPCLRGGVNVLAVRVHHTGLGRSYHQHARPGLLAQLEMNGQVIGTDSNWKVRLDPTWHRESPRINGWHDAYTEIIDFREQLRDWTKPGYEDSRWEAARGLSREHGWPEVQGDAAPRALTPPWVSLTPRDIPYLAESRVRAERLIQSGIVNKLPVLPLPHLGAEQAEPSSIHGVAEYQQGDGPFTIDPRTSEAAFVVFDLGKMVNGYPRLSLSGPRGAVVEVMTAAYMINNRFDPLMLRSRQIDQIILSGTQDEWEAFHFKPARYLAIAVRNSRGPVKISDAGITGVEYPFRSEGDFHAAEDPVLEELWRAGAKTVKAVTTDAYTDNYRERRQYSQTSYYAARGNYAAFGDPFLQRRYLIQIAQEQEPDGILPSYAPLTGDDFMVILESGLFWVRGLRDYLLFSGDAAGVRALLPVAAKTLARMREMTNGSGLIEDPPYAYWLDHSPLDRRGANFVLNGHYLLALEDYAEALEWLGDPGGEDCRVQAARVRAGLRSQFWEPGRQLLVDAVIGGQRFPRFSEHSNSMALAAGVATPEQAAAIATRLLEKDSGLVPVTPAFMEILVNGLAMSGHVAGALAVLKDRFGKFLHQGNGTLWEEWWLDGTMRNGRWQPHTRADAQGESAFPPLTIARWVLGIRPARPGMSEVVLEYPNSGLREVSGTMPSPHGSLSVAWSVQPDELVLETRCPAGMTLKLDLAGIGAAGYSPSPTSQRYRALPSGKSSLRFQRSGGPLLPRQK